MERIRGEEEYRVKNSSTQLKMPKGMANKRDYSELYKPDSVDYWAMVWVVVAECLVLLYITDILYYGVSVGFSGFFMFIGILLQLPMVYTFYGLLYLSYWCWRWGYYSVYHMQTQAKKRAERLMKNEGMVWDMKFFGLLFSLIFIIFAQQIALVVSIVLA